VTGRCETEKEVEITPAMVRAGAEVLAVRWLDLVENLCPELMTAVSGELLTAALQSRR